MTHGLRSNSAFWRKLINESDHAVGMAKVKDIVYDVNTGLFKDLSNDTQFTDKQFSELAKTAAARSFVADSASLKRSAIAHTLLREESTSGRGLLLGSLSRLARNDLGQAKRNS